MYCDRTRKDCPIKGTFAKHPGLEQQACPHCLKQHENDETIRERILKTRSQSDRSRILL